MMKDARVVTSKFLQLKNELDNSIKLSHRKVYADTEDIYSMVMNIHRAFGVLCELLHELTIEEDSN